MDELERSLKNFLVWDGLNRLAVSRRQFKNIDSLLDLPDARFLIMHRGSCLFSEDKALKPVLLKRKQIGTEMLIDAVLVLLGTFDNTSIVSIGLAENLDAAGQFWETFGRFSGLRSASPLLRSDDASLIAYAKAMQHWHERHRFCSRCGALCKPAQAGHLRVCSAGECGAAHFPRTDPAVIVCVTDGERCLLGRQTSWPPKRYSVIAGFVEPGESAEQAVVREVMEETGVNVERVHYHSSQPWPFPGSLMLGYTAYAQPQAIRRHDEELAEAAWYSRDDIANGVKTGALKLSPPISIAWRLLEDWYDDGKHGKLASVVNARPR